MIEAWLNSAIALSPPPKMWPAMRLLQMRRLEILLTVVVLMKKFLLICHAFSTLRSPSFFPMKLFTVMSKSRSGRKMACSVAEGVFGATPLTLRTLFVWCPIRMSCNSSVPL